MDAAIAASVPLTTDVAPRGGLAPQPATLCPPPGALPPHLAPRIAAGLYDRIEADAVLRPAFGPNLEGERRNVARFFAEWAGGVPGYFGAGGRQSLGEKHARIAITPEMAERWLDHFAAAVSDAGVDPSPVMPAARAVAEALVNRPAGPRPGERVRSPCSGAALRTATAPLTRDDGAGLAAVVHAMPGVQQRYGPLLLLLAAAKGRTAAARALLDLGAPAGAAAVLSHAGAAALRLPTVPLAPVCAAIARSRKDTAALLAARGAGRDIFTAAVLDDTEAAAALLARDPSLADVADPASDLALETPLTHAIAAGSRACAALFLQQGASVSLHGGRLLGEAGANGDAELVSLLLARGATCATLGPGSWALHPAIAAQLVERGADVNRPPGRWIGLCCTGNSGHSENAPLAAALLRLGADVHALYGGRTALHCAARAGFLEVAKLLLAHGADPNAVSDAGLTPLGDLATARTHGDQSPMRALLAQHGGR